MRLELLAAGLALMALAGCAGAPPTVHREGPVSVVRYGQVVDQCAHQPSLNWCVEACAKRPWLSWCPR